MRAIPEGYRLQEGDIVVILATVKYPRSEDEDHVFLEVPGNYSGIRTPLKDIKGIHCHNIKKGSEVFMMDENGQALPQRYHVVFVSGDLAWITRENNAANAVVNLGKLIPTPPPVDTAPAEPPPAPPPALTHEGQSNPT